MADASASSRKQSLPETWSSCHAQTITAAHNFRVTNFSLLEGMGTGKFVDSKSFSVGGSNWTIRLYPDGMETEPEAYAVAFLWFNEGETGVRVKFNLDLLGRDGQVDALLYKAHCSFEDVDCGWGWKIKKSDLHPLLRLNNDSFTLRCVLTVIKDPKVEKDANAIVVPQSSLLQDLAHMLKDREGTDVTFRVGDRLFPAHRCVLAARSPVFKAELFGPMKEKDAEHVITVHDMEPCVFEALLQYIYTDTSASDDDWDAGKNVPVQHLLVAADRYGVDKLRLLCEENICSTIDAETVATTLALAEQHHCVQLKKACLSFITSRGVLGAVMQTDGFEHLAASCPLVFLEILDGIASLGN